MVKAKAKQYGSYVQAWSCAFIQLYYNNHINPEVMSSLSDKLRFCWCISGCTVSTSPLQVSETHETDPDTRSQCQVNEQHSSHVVPYHHADPRLLVLTHRLFIYKRLSD